MTPAPTAIGNARVVSSRAATSRAVSTRGFMPGHLAEHDRRFGPDAGGVAAPRAPAGPPRPSCSHPRQSGTRVRSRARRGRRAVADGAGIDDDRTRDRRAREPPAPARSSACPSGLAAFAASAGIGVAQRFAVAKSNAVEALQQRVVDETVRCDLLEIVVAASRPSRRVTRPPAARTSGIAAACETISALSETNASSRPSATSVISRPPGDDDAHAARRSPRRRDRRPPFARLRRRVKCDVSTTETTASASDARPRDARSASVDRGDAFLRRSAPASPTAGAWMTPSARRRRPPDRRSSRRTRAGPRRSSRCRRADRRSSARPPPRRSRPPPRRGSPRPGVSARMPSSTMLLGGEIRLR